LLHFATDGGDLECIKWVMSNVTIDINAANSNGCTPIMRTLVWSDKASSKFLLERGANIFMKNNEGTRAIDCGTVGLQVLHHAEELRWSAIKEFLLLYKSCQSPARCQVESSTIGKPDDILLKRRRTASLAASVIGSPDLSRSIASFLIRSELIIRVASIPKPSDAATLRIEASLASSSSSSS